MKRLVYLVLPALILLAGGCVPDDFLWWSPNGRTAAVRTPHGLRLATAEGKLSGIVLPGEIQSAAWLPDGSGLVVSRTLTVSNWAAAEKLLSPEEVATSRQLARSMPDLLKAGLMASGGSFDNAEQLFLKPLGMAENEILWEAMFCALSVYREQMFASIDTFTNAAVLKDEIHSFETNGLPVNELIVLPMSGAEPKGEPKALISSVQKLEEPLVSPHHGVVAYRTGTRALKAITLDGKTSIVIAEEEVARAVWSPDGRALTYVTMGKTDKVGEIRSRTVVSDTGELVQGPPQAQLLAMAIFAPGAPPRLSVLPDGRILFASMSMILPVPASRLPSGAQFFLIDPAHPDAAPVPVTITQGSLPEDLNAFALSPDGRYVAVVESGTDVVALLELATGKVRIISPLHNGWKSRMVPAWKNTKQLTFAAPSITNTAMRPELYELSLGQENAVTRLLSKQWPDDLVRQWLETPGNTGRQGGR